MVWKNTCCTCDLGKTRQSQSKKSPSGASQETHWYGDSSYFRDRKDNTKDSAKLVGGFLIQVAQKFEATSNYRTLGWNKLIWFYMPTRKVSVRDSSLWLLL